MSEPAPPRPAPPRPGPPVAPEVYRRRRLVVLGGLVVAVLVVLALLALVWPGFATSDDEAAPAPAVTVTPSAAPTPAISPAARAEDDTALALALPDHVLRFALVSEGDSTAFDEQDPHEAWRVVYADGEGSGAAKVTVDVGQWTDEDDAADAYEAATASLGDPVGSGDVLVGQDVAGTYVRVDDGSGTSTVVWRNGTVVLRASGPSADMADVYAAYPL
ncbi:hypothetical protein [Cellulomonas sp. PhB143]|uniref:hypothetical protein n=1 Tax=Cellulomonas sp. PhB143 TaxID=2485186 RepID=UPI000FA1B412|nr:hypothetical protein [Cellulomonas sp. PhB143]ROS76667.1 hypothetical protein EDF32_1488 [Cellulomonas sp. PhB143]